MPRVVVAGGAGFIGSHLVRRLLADGWEVVVVDSLLTGVRDNVPPDDGLTFIEHDVTTSIPVDGPLDLVMHLASPASPVDYLRHPLETLAAGSDGTRNALQLALTTEARFLLTSTSEVYGDALVHPQKEDYWGNVNPIGPRSVYDESKRFAEAIASAYARERGLDVRIARLFNTYGPRMRRGDGRAVPAFLEQALANTPITVHGDGLQTRSLCFVDDIVEGLVRLAASDVQGPVNLGNPHEITVRVLADLIREATGSTSEIVEVARPQDDPNLRRPDIGRARDLLGWEPVVSLRDGLARTIGWARDAWGYDQVPG